MRQQLPIPKIRSNTIPIRRQDEIFDLTADPYETNNLADLPEYAGVATFLDETLASWVDVSYPYLQYPTLVEKAEELLEVSRSF